MCGGEPQKTGEAPRENLHFVKVATDIAPSAALGGRTLHDWVMRHAQLPRPCRAAWRGGVAFSLRVLKTAPTSNSTRVTLNLSGKVKYVGKAVAL